MKTLYYAYQAKYTILVYQAKLILYLKVIYKRTKTQELQQL